MLFSHQCNSVSSGCCCFKSQVYRRILLDLQVLRFIDGKRFIMVIALDADMDLKIVKHVVRLLV